MIEPTWLRRDAASLIFNLPGYHVIEDGCPDCGVLSARVHSWAAQRVKDVPAGGQAVQVVVVKPRHFQLRTGLIQDQPSTHIGRQVEEWLRPLWARDAVDGPPPLAGRARE